MGNTYKLFRAFILFVIVVSYSVLQGQDSLRLYLGIHEEPVPVAYAFSFRDLLKVKDSTDLYVGIDYYMAGFLKAKASYVKVGEHFYRKGQHVGYYPDGKKKEEGAFTIDPKNQSSVKAGKWKYYYKSGTPQEETVYVRNPGKKEELVMSYWDSTGRQLVTKGEGVYTYVKEVLADSVIQRAYFTGPVKRGKKNGNWVGMLGYGRMYSDEVFNDGALTSGTRYITKARILKFDLMNRPAMYEPGEAVLYTILQEVVDYPEMERDSMIQGTVTVKFTVNENGSLSDFTVVKGVSPALDKEALRSVKQFPPFLPKLVNGKAVKSEFTMPVTFRIM